MPSPTPAQVDAIVARLFEAIENGTREPTAVLSAEEHQVLLDLHIHNVVAAGVVEQQLREHARTLTGEQAWRAADVNRISFRVYERGAMDHRRRQEAIDRASNIVRMAAQAGGPRARSHNQSAQSDTGDMDAASMVLSDSIRLQALGLLQQQRQGRVWYDTFYKRALCDWKGDFDGTVIEPRAIDDAFIGRVTTWLHILNGKLARLSEMNVKQILLSFARNDIRNEPRDWLRTQQWDGVPRLGVVMTRGFGARDTTFNREAGRCWFVSMVARIMVAGAKVDTMPVFIGGQGLFKSQALEVIGGPWYRAASSAVDSKDFLQELHGALVFEIPELHSIVASRGGTAKIKAVLSTRVDHFRLPFGYMPEDHERTAVMAGTTNNRDWHGDETGARRFWPVHVGRIDLAWLREWRGQSFAEALAYYDAAQLSAAAMEAYEPGMATEAELAEGETVRERGKWWNVPESEQAELMEGETATHPWAEIIEARLEYELGSGGLYTGEDGQRPTAWDGTAGEATDWGNTLTVTRIGVAWLGCSPETLGRGSAHGKNIASIMRSLGWELKRVRIDGVVARHKLFIHPGRIAEQMTRTLPDESRTIRSDEDDIPF